MESSLPFGLYETPLMLLCALLDSGYQNCTSGWSCNPFATAIVRPALNMPSCRALYLEPL
ncbi:hypothetical protein MBAV_001690 [Candidatus Magnetobacterium bavaricum]|uniref:Uncharacterized protein n=1 Tax=Candidatus Magnetobacterium bavaricum TaxID=29290 RepID=A0A0F3GZI4_9BACT|nr:hypothetical protein MBAV_001690 [Candidatus Magnetobacterium bavaricum]